MCDCKCVVLELMPEYHKDWTVDETDVLFEWFKAYELEIRTALEQAQKVEGLVEVAAELLWQRDYPNGGSMYKKYDDLQFHDKEFYRKEVLLRVKLRAAGVLKDE